MSSKTDTPVDSGSFDLAWHERQLRRLIALRWMSIATMLLFTLPAAALLDLRLPTSALLTVPLALAGINFLLIGWLSAPEHTGRGPGPFTTLLLDLLAWSAFLYFCGGATNPLISVMLPLVAVGATVLSAVQAWSLAVIAVLAYTVLWEHYQPVGLGDPGLAATLHLFGMWLTFVLSAGVIAAFVVRMTALLRERDDALAAAAAEMARDGHVVALGNLAAGTAHSLGTPLATIRLVAGELLASPVLPEELREDVQTIDNQVEHCRRTLGLLAAQAGGSRAEGGRRRDAATWIKQVLAAWQAQRPHSPVGLDCEESLREEFIVADQTLAQALQTLVNNAADVSDETITVNARRDGEFLLIEVLDHGPGFPEAPRNAGADAPGERPGGMGIGLFLARHTLGRHGGELSFSARPGGGTIARLRIPLERLRA